MEMTKWYNDIVISEEGLMIWNASTSTENKVAYHRGNGSITVYHMAFFFVYSQVTVLKDKLTNTSFCQSIHRQRAGKEEKLLESFLPNCEVLIHI